VCTEIALCAEDDEWDLNEFSGCIVTEAPRSEDVRTVVVLLFIVEACAAEDLTDEATFDRIEDEIAPQRPYPFWHELGRQ
jgi:hypothetical protein